MLETTKRANKKRMDTLEAIMDLFSRPSDRDVDAQMFCLLDEEEAARLLVQELYKLPEMRRRLAAEFLHRLSQACINEGAIWRWL